MTDGLYDDHGFLEAIIESVSHERSKMQKCVKHKPDARCGAIARAYRVPA